MSVVELLAFLEAAWLPPHPHAPIQGIYAHLGNEHSPVLATCPAEGRLLLCLKLTFLGVPSLLRTPRKVLALEGMEGTRDGFLKKEMGEGGEAIAAETPSS